MLSITRIGPTSFFGRTLLGVTAFALLFSLPSRAQETAASSDGSCTSPAILRQIMDDGRFTRVTTRSDVAGATGQEQGISDAQSRESVARLASAYKRFAKAARKGDARGQVNLAVASLAGWGTSRNPGAALFWLQEGARQGFAPAYYDLAILYMNGCGVRQDFSEAVRYFRLGAEAGDASSQTNLGYLYDQGLGVVRDRMQAATWYRRAADGGLPEAQFDLADLYVRGEGVPLDYSAAFSWFQKAAQQGHSAARIMVGCMYAEGIGPTRDLELAYVWLSAAALQGDSRANPQLASVQLQLSAEQLAKAKARALLLVHSDGLSAQLR